MLKKTRKLFSVSIKDCKVYTFTVGGNGGAGKDTSNTGVRVVHIASGAVGIGVDHRSQLKNKIDAFQRMAKSSIFMAWVRKVAAEIQTGKTLDERVDESMQPENLRIEYRGENGWEDVD